MFTRDIIVIKLDEAVLTTNDFSEKEIETIEDAGFGKMQYVNAFGAEVEIPPVATFNHCLMSVMLLMQAIREGHHLISLHLIYSFLLINREEIENLLKDKGIKLIPSSDGITPYVLLKDMKEVLDTIQQSDLKSYTGSVDWFNMHVHELKLCIEDRRLDDA